MAYVLLVNTELTKYFIDKYLSDLVKEDFFKDKISLVLDNINTKVLDTTEAEKVITKPWLIGYTEAKGFFQLEKISENNIVHSFKLYKKNIPLIVYIVIGRILGIRINFKNSNSMIERKNSRVIANIIKYFSNNLKGFKSFEFKV